MRIRHKTRFLLSISFILLNTVLSIYVILSIGFRGKSLSTPFLLIFGGNMFLYFLYYGARKIFDICENQREKKKLAESRQERELTRECSPEGDTLLWRLARSCGLGEVPAGERCPPPPHSQGGVCLRRAARWFSFILFIISNLTGVIATYFYLNKHQSRNLTPAQSRERNQLCRLRKPSKYKKKCEIVKRFFKC